MNDINKINFSEYIPDELLSKIIRENWIILTLDEKLNLAQTIVNIFLEVANIKIPVKVLFTEFEEGGTRGCYDRNTNILSLNKNLFINGYEIYDGKDIQEYRDANVYFYHVIMHELKHVEQAWIMQFPELNPERANKLIINNLSNKKHNMYIIESDLYKIQISEREAFEFEMIQQQFLFERVKILFEQDIVFRDFEFPAYILNKNNKEFLLEVKNNYQTNTPEQDLDNIMDAIINNNPYDNLNQIMFKEVFKLTKNKRKIFPFFNQVYEVSIECNEIEYDVKSIELEKDAIMNQNNDWLNDR